MQRPLDRALALLGALLLTLALLACTRSDAGPMERAYILGALGGAVLALLLAAFASRQVLRRHLPSESAHVLIEAEHHVLVHRAMHDTLSGLPNRATFVDQLDHAIRRSRRSDERFALLFLDGDEIKSINDRHGHAAGDIAIRTIGERLTAVLRVGDVAARIGGDEFAILIRHVERDEDVDAVIRRITQTMATPFRLPRGDMQTLSLSIGAATYPDHGRTVEALMNHADERMYEQKRSRRLVIN